MMLLCSLTVQARPTITPQLGVNWAFLTNDFSGITYSSQVGYQLGVGLRFGGVLHFQTGIYWESVRKEMTLLLSGAGGDLKNNYINVPALVGIKIIPLKVLDVRLNTGVSFSLLTSVGENDLDLTSDDFNSTHWGWIIGAGTDFLIFSTDISFEFGLSPTVELDIEELDYFARSKSNILRINLGIRL